VLRTRATVTGFLLALALAGCGGSPNTPNGSTVGSPGGPLPPPPSLVSAKVTITLPRQRRSRARRKPSYLSPNTHSISIGLASVDGGPVSGARTTVVNTEANAPGCTLQDGELKCSAKVDAAAGDDTFNVTTYAWKNATGDVLSAGTVPAHIARGAGAVRLDSALSLSIGGVIAKLSMHVAQTSIARGRSAAVPVALDAFDPSGAQIVGASAFLSPVSLSIQGDGIGAFHLHDGHASGSVISVARPVSSLELVYDGNRQASSSISLQASVTQPDAVSATASLAVSGTPPPLAPGTIYVLNAGKKGGRGATLTVYDGSHSGNVAPERTLQLNGTLYARSITVDAAGNVYVGYLDNEQGFSTVAGTPDEGNEIAVYSPGAHDNDAPAYVLGADKAHGTSLFPIAMALDSSGNLVTYGATNLGGTVSDAVLTFAPNSSGPAAPLRAWAFASPSIRYSGPTGLALDLANNAYVDGILHTALAPAPGIFVNASANQSNASSTPSRTIPWDNRTQLTSGQVAGIALDTSGEIFTGNYVINRGAQTSCQARVNVFAGGSGGGTTDNAPLRVLTLDGVTTTNSGCYAPSYPLAGFYPFVTAYSDSIFVADEFGNAVDTFDANASGSVKPSATIAGSATALDVPIGVFVLPPGKTHADVASGPAQVRFIEGAPLLETRVGGAPVGLGTSFLQVNKTTVASYFPYGWISAYSGYPAGVLSVRVLDSLGYSIGPFKTASLASGKSYSIALVGTYPHYKLLTFADAAPSTGGASLAVYEASPAAPKVDFGTFNVKGNTGYWELGSARVGALEVRSLGKRVSGTGAYVGTGTTPMTGGTIALQSVDSFDRRNLLPFHNVSRLSLFVLDPLSGSLLGPVFGVLDGANASETPAPDRQAVQQPAPVATLTPPPEHLYVDHNGTFYEYKLPLSSSSRPLKALVEEPGSAFAPQIATDQYGNVAIVTASQIRFFRKPIVSFAPNRAHRTVALTPAMTEIGPSGADLVDVEYDPFNNLWLFSGLGGEITELRAPLSKTSVASVVIPFGAPGTKTAAYGVVQGRFDVNSTLYVYGQSATSASLFKTSFPYAKSMSPLDGLNIAQAAFVDSSQFLPTDPNPVSVIVGQYFGPLATPPPQQPPPQPHNVLAQFPLPLMPVQGLFPNAIVEEVVGAVAADAPARSVFALDAANGHLSVYPLPLVPGGKPNLTLRCLAGVKHCNEKPEHLFLAP
jgi:hypothetical protein